MWILNVHPLLPLQSHSLSAFLTMPFKLCLQVWSSTGRLDVSFRRRDLSSCEAANLLHKLREIPVGGEHHSHEEAGVSCHTEKNDYYQVHLTHLLFSRNVVTVDPSWLPLMFFYSFRGTVHQSFPDFTFLTGNWIGKLMKLKGEIDPELAIDLCNKATLAFLQRHLGKRQSLPVILSHLLKVKSTFFLNSKLSRSGEEL